MQIRGAQLNNYRLSGNKLFLHTFKNFSTTSAKVSIKIHFIHALLSILILLSIFYVLLVIGTIFNIVNKKEGLANINNISLKTAKIEREYNNTISYFTKEYAVKNGFVINKTNYYASRKDAAASISFLYENGNSQ